MLADFGLLGGTVGSFAFVVLDLAFGGFGSLALAGAPSSSSAQCTRHHAPRVRDYRPLQARAP